MFFLVSWLLPLVSNAMSNPLPIVVGGTIAIDNVKTPFADETNLLGGSAAYAALAEQFTPEEQVQLTMLINLINGWNRLAIGFHLFDPSLAK